MADSILRLRVDSQEYDNKLKRAAEGLQRYADGCRKAGGTLEHLDDGVLEFTKALGKMETVSKTAKGGLGEMTKTFTDLKMQYKQLTDVEKASPFGKALNDSLNQMKSRIKETQKDLQDINKELQGGKFGQFGSIIDTIGQKMGVTGNLTELLTSKTALMTAGIGAAAAAIGKSTEAWVKYNAELAKQDQMTTVTTGLKGDDADRMTDKMRALSDTYKVDFREAINAANTLMSQFGESGDSAIQLIKDGMQGMIQGDGGKLLSMIQQYAPAFRDAGVSASQLVAVIQNSEGGIFTDQNMQAIVMGIKNIRLMTNSTSEALAKLGIDGQKMSEQMSNGSMTVFDALKKVASELQTVDSNSKTAGEVMQTVFGRQGAIAGTNLAKAIEGLNTNLEDTKKQTGEVGEAFADLQEANEKLNVAIREAFSYDGWEQMATGIKAKLVTALAEVVGYLAKIRQLLTGDNTVGWNITPKPGVVNVADDPNVDDNGNYIRKPTNNSGMSIVKTTPTPPPPVIKPTKTTNRNVSTQKLPTVSEFEKFINKRRTDADKLKPEEFIAIPSVWESYKKAIVGDLGEIEDSMQNFKMWTLDFDPYNDKIQEVTKNLQQQQQAFAMAASAASNFGAALASIEDPSAKAAGTVIQAIANIALGFSQAAAQASSMGPYGWIAYLAAGMGAMATTISTIHSLTGYANGGEIKGNSYSGDRIGGVVDGSQFVGLNAGEIVLTRAMAGNLASQLQGNGFGNMRLSTELDGRVLRIVLNNDSQSRGHGKFVTSTSHFG